MSETFEGTVSFFPEVPADDVGLVEFDLRLDNGQFQKVRTSSRVRVGDQVIVIGSFDMNTVLVAETIRAKGLSQPPAPKSFWRWPVLLALVLTLAVATLAALGAFGLPGVFIVFGSVLLIGLVMIVRLTIRVIARVVRHPRK